MEVKAGAASRLALLEERPESCPSSPKLSSQKRKLTAEVLHAFVCPVPHCSAMLSPAVAFYSHTCPTQLREPESEPSVFTDSTLMGTPTGHIAWLARPGNQGKADTASELTLLELCVITDFQMAHLETSRSPLPSVVPSDLPRTLSEHFSEARGNLY